MKCGYVACYIVIFLQLVLFILIVFMIIVFMLSMSKKMINVK